MIPFCKIFPQFMVSGLYAYYAAPNLLNLLLPTMTHFSNLFISKNIFLYFVKHCDFNTCWHNITNSMIFNLANENLFSCIGAQYFLIRRSYFEQSSAKKYLKYDLCIRTHWAPMQLNTDIYYLATIAIFNLSR